MEFYSPSFLHILITKIKKKEMIKHLGINDLFLLIDMLKNQTIEYLSQVPQRDMSLYLALQILFHYFIGIHVWSDALVQDFGNFFFFFLHSIPI